MASSIDLGPFSHHVYLAFCTYDFPRVEELRRNLESQGILCLARHDSSQASASTMSAIKNGIARSRKMVIYMSEHYSSAVFSDIEVSLINEKASRFSRDAVIILKHRSVTQAECNKTFPSLNSREIQEGQLCDVQFARQLSVLILQEPNCQLVTMPKKNIGYGAAVGYFYGYLRLVLPEFSKRLLEDTMCGQSEEAIRNTVRKMLIIMPESCWCPPLLTDDERCKPTDKFVLRSANRAGNKCRDYKSSLYSLYDDASDQTYYFVGELATPLLTMFESYFYDMTGMTKDDLYTERDAFYWTLKAVLNHEKNQDCNDQFELLVWKSDPKFDVSEEKVIKFYDFVLPQIRRLIQIQNEQEENPKAKKKAQLCTDDAMLNVSTSASVDSFTIVETPGANPGGVYDNMAIGAYPMSRDNRGLCLIICNKSFEKSQLGLEPRAGSAFDTDSVTKVFTDLKFEVEVHEDLALETLERLLLTTKLRLVNRDDSSFACVIMTHGKCGVLYTADSKAIRILDVVDYFGARNCPSLAGKPKMFFIQACQRDHSQEGTTPETWEQPNEQLAMDGQYPVTCAVDRSLEEDAATEKTLFAAEGNQLRALLAPSEPDFVMSYATLPGSTAYRDPDVGSLYITELCAQLSRREAELDRALKMVAQQVKRNLEQSCYDHLPRKIQVPFHVQTTDKLINL